MDIGLLAGKAFNPRILAPVSYILHPVYDFLISWEMSTMLLDITPKNEYNG
jgi:hypothetical protein